MKTSIGDFLAPAGDGEEFHCSLIARRHILATYGLVLALDPDALSPKEALELLYRLKKTAEGRN